MKLKGVQDIAGARIVDECGRAEQDEIVRRIVAEFADAARPPKVKDRRAEPSAGYRAVHVVVTVQDVPVEIQVRTWRQDQWAQIVETLGDKWGRGLRYGAEPDDPDAALSLGVGFTTRRDLWQGVLDLGDRLAEVEDIRQSTVVDDPALLHTQLGPRLARLEDLLRAELTMFARVADVLQ